MLKIYFAGSIRGGREHIDFYIGIIEYLQNFGEVLTEHVGNSSITPEGENTLTDNFIFNRDMEWLSSSDVIVAEVSNPSLGVGFEIASAIGLKKKILCLFKKQVNKKLSAMIAGCPDITVKEYVELDEAKKLINDFLSDLK